MLTRRRLLAACSAGAASLAGCQGLADRPSDDEIDVFYTATSPPSDDAGEPGWLLVSRRGEAYAFTFDLRFCGEVTSVEVHETAPGEYEAAVTATIGDPGCRRTRLSASFELPVDRFSLRLTVNGTTLETVERDGTTPTSLHDLPDRLDAPPAED